MGGSREARWVEFMRLEPQNVCRPVPQPWEAPALCSHGHGVRRCSQKTKNNHCFAGSWLSSLSLLCGRVQRGGRLGTGGVPPRGPTGHVHEVSPQQPWGGVLSLKDSPRQHPQRGLGKGQGQRSHILQRLEPATRAEEGKGEARRRKPEARGQVLSCHRLVSLLAVCQLDQGSAGGWVCQ